MLAEMKKNFIDRRHELHPALSLLLDVAIFVWEVLSPYLLIVALVMAAYSSSPWIYQPILFLGLLCPGFFLCGWAFTGRSESRGLLSRFSDHVGTAGCIVTGVTFLGLYGFALKWKLGL